MATFEEQLEAARRGHLETAQAFDAPAAPVAPGKDVGIVDRATSNFEDAFYTNTFAGQGTRIAQTAVRGKQAVKDTELARQKSFENQQSWLYNNPNTVDTAPDQVDPMGNRISGSADPQLDVNLPKTLLHGTVALDGQIAGNMATPETLVTAPAGLARRAVQIADPALRWLAKRGLGAATQTVVNTVTDPVIQGSEMYLGTRDEFDPKKTITSAALGAATGGVLPQMPAAAKALEAQNNLLRQRLGEAANRLTDFHSEFKMPDDLKGEKYIGSLNTETNKLSGGAYDEIRRMTDENGQYAEARRLHLGGDVDQVKRLAEDMNRPEDYYLRRWQPGTTFPPEDIWQIRKLHANAAENVVSLSKLAADGDPMAVEMAAVAYQRFQQFEAILQGSATEWGRTGAIFNQVISSEERSAAIKSMEKQFGGKIPPQDFFRLMASLEDPRMVRKFAQDAKKATTGRMLIEAWQSALLSSPDTHVANMIGSFITTVMSTPEQMGAALAGKGRQFLMGGEDPTTLRASVARLAGLWQGSRDGLRLAAEAFRTERAPGIQTGDIRNAIPGTTGSIIRTPLRALLAEDTFFKQLNKQMALVQMATDEAIKREIPDDVRAQFIRNFINNPPAHVASKAEAMGKYYTFNAELGKLGNSFLQMKESHPAIALLMPFVRTPINIMKQGFERSPLAAFYIGPQMMQGKLKGKELDNAISRMMMGSGIMAAAVWQAYQGNIVGQGPMNPGERQNIQDLNAQTVAIRLPDGSFHSYSRAQPIGMTLGLAADYVQMWREYEDSIRSGKRDETGNPMPEAMERMAQYAIWVLGKNMLQGSFVTQLNNAFDTIMSPDKDLGRFARTTIGSFVPTVVARVAQGSDPVVRDPQSVAEMLASRIPGQTDKATPKIDRFGNESKREAGLVESLLWPFRRTAQKDDPVYKEITRLGVTFDDVSRYWEGRRLTTEQYVDLVKFTGQGAKKELDALINSPGWNRVGEDKPFPDEIKKEEIRKVMEHWMKEGKDMMIGKYRDLAYEQPNEQIRKLRQAPRPQFPFIK